MELVMLQDLGLVLQVWLFACLLVIQGSSVASFEEGKPGYVYVANVLIGEAPTPVPQPIGKGLQPPFAVPSFKSAPAPQTTKGLPSSISPSPSMPTPNPFVPPPASTPDPVPFTPPIPPSTNPPSTPTPNPFVPPPTSTPDPVSFTPPIPPSTNPHSTPTPNPSVPPPASTPDPIPLTPPIPPSPNPQLPEHPPFTAQAPAPVISPSSSSPPDKQTHPAVPKSTPPTSHKSIAPINNAPLSAVAPVSNVPAPRGMPESPPSSHSALPNEPPSPPPDVSARPAVPRNSPPLKPVLHEPPSSPPAPPPRIGKKTVAMPVVAPIDRITPNRAPVSRSPAEAPTASNTQGHRNSAPPPHQFSKSTGSPKPHHSKVFKTSSAPPPNVIPPLSSGSSASSSPDPSAYDTYSPIPAPAPAYSSSQAKIPVVEPKISPSGSSQRSPKIPLAPPLRALPPPPPHTDCAPLTCTEPLAYGPPEAPCVCVLPIQVGLRLSVALYTFFPLVSELAAEVAAGAFMKQSQVRIMGANAAGDNTEKTIVLIDLLPLGEKFDDTTAYLTFQRFWRRQVVIKTSIFGDYDVLYVRYPGLPPSPPLPPSTISIIPSKPYPGNGNNGRTMQPLGVDISRKQHKHGLSRSILAIIILSCFVALILLCAAAWVFIFRDRQCPFLPDPTPPMTIRSLAKTSGIAGSRIESGMSSPSFSLGSSIAAYTGSAKTFSSSDIDKATDFFNEENVLGEGGFGRVYSGVLEDGAKVAIKILKRYDQQSGREFLAEVEMLSRLHHRNLVKLIGICVEDRTRCLVYELVPNGSVESHLHGIDKERSPLDWGARLKIALGAARALAYLHEDSSPRVIHRDFKASNILLEDDFTPKVSDFGLARAALDEENKHISTRVMGTFGYVAPEYAMTGHLLVKSDVYSYGVVLLELLTGRKPVDMSQPPGEENLVSWARPLLTSREGLESIIDQSVVPDIPFDSIAKVAAIASMCVQPEVSHRPFMGEVVQALKLICSECDGVRELPSRSCSHEDLSLAMEARNSTNSDTLPAPLLSPPSTVSDYDYLLDVERDLSMSELLSSSAKFGAQDSESFRRHSSSGPLRTSKSKPLWRTMRRAPRGSVSEHGVMFRLWPGSH
ncbi:Protein kinase superfamily protein [Perilla frutescens var. hirtella]|uniref:Protein kinase superfamily protein n=1 Tax=Perilla frutescens var. hirtella TaxID=608512 RepID=A0AAD4J9G8_PERFH|nr:Protein kinase superfamily protein [Perilla frutescens var. hirtella]